jgi:hypothetical protein
MNKFKHSTRISDFAKFVFKFVLKIQFKNESIKRLEAQQIGFFRPLVFHYDIMYAVI